MSDLPLDCEYELVSDPVLLHAQRLSRDIHECECRGFCVLQVDYARVRLAEIHAERRRAEILAKYGVKA